MFFCILQVFLPQPSICSSTKLQWLETSQLRPWLRSWLKQENTQRFGRKISPGKRKSPGEQRPRTKIVTQKAAQVSKTKKMGVPARQLKRSIALLKTVEAKVAGSCRKILQPVRSRRMGITRAVKVELLLQKVTVKRRKGKGKRVATEAMVRASHFPVRLHLHAQDLKFIIWVWITVVQRRWISALHASNHISIRREISPIRSLSQVATG